MGDVVNLATLRRRPTRRSPGRDGLGGEIALFTGVRIERWVESRTERGGDDPGPRPLPPRRRGGR